MSNSCFYSFCRFVKAGLCSLTPGTPRQQSGWQGAAWADGESAGSSARDAAWLPAPSSEPGARTPGNAGGEREANTPGSISPFWFKEKKKHLGIIFPQWQQHKTLNSKSDDTHVGPSSTVSELCALGPIVSPLKVCFSVYKIGGVGWGAVLRSVLIRTKQGNNSKPPRIQLVCCSVTKSCPTLRDAMRRSTPGRPVPHQLMGFAPVHAHWMGDAYLSKKTNRIQ